MILSYLGCCGNEIPNDEAYLLGRLPIDEIRKRNVVIFGTGRDGNSAHKFLRDNGVVSQAFCSNNPSEWGKFQRALEILKPTDALKLKDVYFVISSKLLYNSMKNQLLLKNIYDFSTLIITSIGGFSNPHLTQIVQKSILPVVLSQMARGGQNVNEDFVDCMNLLGVAFMLIRCSDIVLDKYVTKYMPMHKPKRILDIGPGNGLISYILCQCIQNLSVDWCSLSKKESIEESYIDIVNEAFPVRIFHGKIENPNYNFDEKYDIIVLTQVMEHFQCNPIPTIKKIADMLNDDGFIIFSIPHDKLHNFDSYCDMPHYNDLLEYEKMTSYGWQNYIDVNFPHCYSYSEHELREIFDTAGLKMEYYYQILPYHIRHAVLAKKNSMI